MAKLEKLISLYDCIAWIPSIRGSLSLDLIDNANNILGDVDKYSIKFKKTNGLHSEHYIIASSLLTVNDSKVGRHIRRSFRYIFTGLINNKDEYHNFLSQNHLLEDTDLNKYIEKEGLMLGRLTIISEVSQLLSDIEVTFLQRLLELSRIYDKYRDEFAIQAASMEQLEITRAEMLRRWEQLKEIISQIENDDKNKRPTFCFDVALTRDGILLLKDVTSREYRDYYAAPNTADDYTQHVPIHRLFKVAMNYVKYLFHSNYHHNQEHDTYLPASNLHPAKVYNPLDLYCVFRHQLNAFLVPVIKLKRGRFSDYSIDAQGILLYARAFIEVFRNNGLIDNAVASNSEKHCDILEKEIGHMTAQQNTLLNSVISQHNWIVISTGILAFIFTCLKLYTIFVDIPKLNYTNLDENLLRNDVIGILSLAILGFIIYVIPHYQVLNKQFKLKVIKKNYLFRNCNLDKKRFSLLYRIDIGYNSLKLIIGIKVIQIIRFIVLSLCLIIVLGGLYYFILEIK